MSGMRSGPPPERPGKRRGISLQQRLRPAPFRGRILRRLVRNALDLLDAAGADLRILVVGDAEMARANLRFLGHEGTTTVLTFPEEAPGQAEAGRITGDILVSADACLSRTEGWPESPEERVFFFIVHGILHLLGQDHLAGRGEAVRMRRMELRVYRKVLAKEPGRG